MLLWHLVFFSSFFFIVVNKSHHEGTLQIADVLKKDICSHNCQSKYAFKIFFTFLLWEDWIGNSIMLQLDMTLNCWVYMAESAYFSDNRICTILSLDD